MSTKPPDDFKDAEKPRKKEYPEGLWRVRDALGPSEKRADARIESIKTGIIVLIIPACLGGVLYFAKTKEDERMSREQQVQQKKKGPSTKTPATKIQPTESQNLPRALTPTELEQDGGKKYRK